MSAESLSVNNILARSYSSGGCRAQMQLSSGSSWQPALTFSPSCAKDPCLHAGYPLLVSQGPRKKKKVDLDCGIQDILDFTVTSTYIVRSHRSMSPDNTHHSSLKPYPFFSRFYDLLLDGAILGMYVERHSPLNLCILLEQSVPRTLSLFLTLCQGINPPP